MPLKNQQIKESSSPPLSLKESLGYLQSQLDCYVQGHHDVKEAILLALVTHEHMLLAGESGCAKTWLAEIISAASGLKSYFIQLHRDTRLSDLLGNTVISRIKQGAGKELILQSLQAGKLLTSELCILDDLNCVTGDALNVLLRILNERKYQQCSLPLMTVIATTRLGAPHNEPLDASHLDRFTIQIRAQGIITQQNWAGAKQVINRWQGEACLPPSTAKLAPQLASVSTCLRDSLAAVNKVKFTQIVADAYTELLIQLSKQCHLPSVLLGDRTILLSDRTMLRKAPLLIKAKALLEGRQQVELADLHVLRHLLTFRLPTELYQALAELIELVIQRVKQQFLSAGGLQDHKDHKDHKEHSQAVFFSSEEAEELSGTKAGSSNLSDGLPDGDQALTQQIGEMIDAKVQHENGQVVANQLGGTKSRQREVTSEKPQAVQKIAKLLEIIEGNLARNMVQLADSYGGSPREYKRMHHFDDLLDSDLVEAALWVEQPHPSLPRAYRRLKKQRGGQMVIIRDISQSMAGRYARWTYSVITHLVALVRKKRMKIGYLEFNHEVHQAKDQLKFFTRNYDSIIYQAANVACAGVTNYQYPLQQALEALEKEPLGNKHILFITDGEPTQGDWVVIQERKKAISLGVRIHTLFIGSSQCPEILDILSEETAGSQFQASPVADGSLSIEERRSNPNSSNIKRSQDLLKTSRD